jgi:FG-GAP-like repeat
MRSRSSAAMPRLVLTGTLLLAAVAHADTPPDMLLFPALKLETSGNVRLGDVDGDGHADAVYPGSNDRVVVRLGDGQGGFGPAVDSAPFHPDVFEIEVADLDGDGDGDVAFTQGPGESVVVARSIGGGALELLGTLPLTQDGYATRLELADLNGDGLPDVIAAQDLSSRLTIYLNTGGAFAQPPIELAAVALATSLEADDVDGDGHVDIVVREEWIAGGDLIVLRGHGDGSFDPLQTVASGGQWSLLALGDLTGDGVADIASLVSDPPSLEVRAWQGTGFGAPLVTPLTPTSPFQLALGDLDGDGRLDAVVAHNAGPISTLLQQPDGTLVAQPALAGGGSYFDNIDLADLDSDGALDLWQSSWGTMGGGLVLRGDGHGGLRSQTGLTAELLAHDVADFDGDGHPDVVAVCGFGKPGRLVRSSLGGQLGAEELFDAGPQPEHVLAFDATGDGVPDAVCAGGPWVALAAGLGDGHFAAPLLTAMEAPVIGLDAEDMDADGQPDLVALLDGPVQPGFRTVRLLLATGGALTLDGGLSLTGNPIATAAGDMNEDGATDLVVTALPGGISIWLDNGPGYTQSFTADQPFDDPQLLLQDMNGDGHLDVIGPASDVFVYVVQGSGTGQLGHAAELLFDEQTHTAVVADLDGDGVQDIAACSQESNPHRPFGVRRGLGGGQFDTLVTGALGDSARLARAADMNGDGISDLVVGLEGFTLVQLLSGQGPWTALGQSLAGPAGWSSLEAWGTLLPDSTLTLRIGDGLPGATTFLVAGFGEALAPFKGGVLVPTPDAIVPLGPLDAQGDLQIAGTWPAGAPSDVSLVLQAWRVEAGAPQGFAATTAVRGETP